MPLTLRFTLVTALALLAACETTPEYVFIPAPTYQEGLTVRADLQDGEIGVGEWVTLHANRIMGPWVRVHRDSVPKGVTCTRKGQPTSPDLEVASKLKWEVLPPGKVKFNMPQAPDFDRQIQFTEPGDYRLWAISDAPCRGEFGSDTIRIRVN